MIPRSSTPPRKNYLPKSSKPIRRVNPVAKAKRSAKYKAFLASSAWKKIRRAAIERAGNQCEELYPLGQYDNWHSSLLPVRCLATTRLTVDHLTYARFGGNELPEDLRVLCRDCHMRRHALEGKRIG